MQNSHGVDGLLCDAAAGGCRVHLRLPHCFVRRPCGRAPARPPRARCAPSLIFSYRRRAISERRRSEASRRICAIRPAPDLFSPRLACAFNRLARCGVAGAALRHVSCARIWSTLAAAPVGNDSHRFASYRRVHSPTSCQTLRGGGRMKAKEATARLRLAVAAARYTRRVRRSSTPAHQHIAPTPVATFTTSPRSRKASGSARSPPPQYPCAWARWERPRISPAPSKLSESAPVLGSALCAGRRCSRACRRHGPPHGSQLLRTHVLCSTAVARLGRHRGMADR